MLRMNYDRLVTLTLTSGMMGWVLHNSVARDGNMIKMMIFIALTLMTKGTFAQRGMQTVVAFDCPTGALTSRRKCGTNPRGSSNS